MRYLFPAHFRLREWILSILAVAMAIVSGWLTYVAGLGAGVAWMLCAVVGTVFLVAVAGADRCFFTALFTGLLAAGLITAMLFDAIFVQQRSPGRDEAWLFLIAFFGFVALPSAFAWLVTFVIQVLVSVYEHLVRASRHDDHNA